MKLHINKYYDCKIDSWEYRIKEIEEFKDIQRTIALIL